MFDDKEVYYQMEIPALRKIVKIIKFLENKRALLNKKVVNTHSLA